jgi:hypothetical protein
MQPLDLSGPLRLSSARHPYAFRLIEHGEPLAYVRDQLGSHSIKITADVYAHLNGRQPDPGRPARRPRGNRGGQGRLKRQGHNSRLKDGGCITVPPA